MKVILLSGVRKNQKFDIPEKDAKKLIKKKMAKACKAEAKNEK